MSQSQERAHVFDERRQGPDTMDIHLIISLIHLTDLALSFAEGPRILPDIIRQLYTPKLSHFRLKPSAEDEEITNLWLSVYHSLKRSAAPYEILKLGAVMFLSPRRKFIMCWIYI